MIIIWFLFFLCKKILYKLIIFSKLSRFLFSLFLLQQRRNRILYSSNMTLDKYSYKLLLQMVFLLLPIELQRLSQSAGLGVLGLVNFYFYWRTDYFEPNFQFAPLIHTWTISIEEQFYLLLPLSISYQNHL